MDGSLQVEKLGFSRETYTELKKAGIRFVADLQKMSEDCSEISSERGKCEIIEKLKVYGIKKVS